jgi:hypothetical protein
MLPGDVLLEIFDFYYERELEHLFIYLKGGLEMWITLAQVCRRWRRVVFQSPHRLNLRLVCTPNTPVRDTLDTWPPFPLIIHDSDDVLILRSCWKDTSDVDNIIAALEHNDRVCKIDLKCLTRSRLEYVADSAAVQKPFPELKDCQLDLDEDEEPEPILPNSFLGGVTPHLRSLSLFRVPFPGLPRLLLSATHLVYLTLVHIPPSGYIPPEAMATSLSALTNLEGLGLHFRHPRPRPAIESRPLPPPTRSILSSLTAMLFKGVSEYLEEILARIDAPRLNDVHIEFFNQTIFDTPQLFQFISRRPTLGAPEQGNIVFGSNATIIKFPVDDKEFKIQIACTASDWQLSALEQVCTPSFPPLLTLEDLYISEVQEDPPCWQDDVENELWLDLLRLFVAVKNLYLCKEFVPRIAPALQELGGRTTVALSTLENIFLEGFQLSEPLHEGIGKFVAARRLTSHPVAVSPWETYEERHRWIYSNDDQ